MPSQPLRTPATAQSMQPGPSRRAWLDSTAEFIAREIPGLVALFLVTGLQTVMLEDIGFFDESAYLSVGLGPTSGTFASGSGYSDMYRLLSITVHDPVSLYFTGRTLAAFLFVIGVWAAVRLHASGRIAWAAAAVACTLPIAHVWPGVASPGAGLLIFAVSLLFRWPSPMGLAIASGLTWITATMRPEFAPLAISLTLVLVIWSVVQLVKRQGRRTRASSAAALAVGLGVPALLIGRFGAPVGGGNRLWAAFTQHYAQRHARPGEDPWLQTDVIAGRELAGASNLGDAITQYPLKVAGHLAANGAATPRALMEFIWSGRALADSVALLGRLMFLVLAVGAIIAGVQALRQRAAGAPQGSPRRSVLPWALAAGAAGTTAIVLLVIAPRQHYMLVVAGAVLTLAAILIGRNGTVVVRGTVLVLIVSLFGLYAVQNLGELINRSVPQKPLAATVRAVEADGKPRNYLAAEWGLSVFAPTLRPLTDLEPRGTFMQFLDENDVDAVLVTEALKTGTWSRLEGFRAFVDDPSSFGFRPAIPASSLWLRNSLAR